MGQDKSSQSKHACRPDAAPLEEHEMVQPGVNYRVI